jgi:Domain of unknown function (DUF4145)
MTQGAWNITPPPLLAECPFCDRAVLAHVQGTYVEQPDDDTGGGQPILYSLVRCEGCGSGLLLGQADESTGWSSPQRLYPVTNDLPLSGFVPEQLRREHDEARACFKAHAYTATAVMVRRTLEGVCQDQGITKKQALVASLRELHTAGRIEGRLLEWAEALRILGNQGAHYTGTPLSRQDAADALALAEALLDYMYVLTAQYERFMRRRSASGEARSGQPGVAG